MKKVLKLIGIILLALIVIVVVFLFFASNAQSAPKNYWESIKSEATVENKYNQPGSYEVDKQVYDALQDETDKHPNHFVVWSPKEEGKYPLVVMVNGTGVPCDKYEAVFKHFASYGYVVIGNNYGTNWDGKHPSETLDFALNTPEIASKIDKDKIAIGGHSQGGMGTFNAISEYDNGKLYDVAFSLSPTNNYLAQGLTWGFNLGTDNAYGFRLENIQIPMMLIAGTGPFDNDTVSPLECMEEECNALNVDKVMFRRADKIDHGNMLYEANGYVIAWLDYYLKGVEENKNAFFGENAEIKTNGRYQDFKSSKLSEND